MTENAPIPQISEEAGCDAASLGFRIRQRREKAGLTPARLSLRIGIPKQVLEKVEAGDASMPFAFFLGSVWRLDSFSSCTGLLLPEGLKARGRSPVDQMMTLAGKRIRSCCLEAGITKEDVARETGLDLPTVTRIGWGTPWVPYRDYAKVFSFLGHSGDLARLLR